MAYMKKSYYVEAYAYSGNTGAPGWPVNWLSVPFTFSPDGKTVSIVKNGETIEAKQGEYIILSKGKFFVCDAVKFGKEFVLV